MYGIAWAANGVGTTGGAGGLLTAFVPLILIFVVFYFLLIVPQRKKQKAQQEMIRNLKKGDRVVTTGGVYGTITKLKKNYIEIEVASQVTLRVQRGAVSSLRGGEE